MLGSGTGGDKMVKSISFALQIFRRIMIEKRKGFLHTRIQQALNKGSNYVDYRMGRIGALVMALVVFSINFFGKKDEYGPAQAALWATTAALKQGTYTFFFGGVIMKMSERLAREVRRRTLALILACVIPSMVSLTLTFGVHNLKGTPLPAKSTIPTAIFVIPSTAVWGKIQRNRRDQEEKEETEA